MRYLPWALLALGAYSAVPPLMRAATSGTPRLPSTVAALVSNAILVAGSAVVVLYLGYDLGEYARHPKLPLVVAAGVFLTVGILAYYRALSLGPVSVVTPVFGLFLVVSSAVGVLVLEESLTARKVAGIALAVVAVYLVTAE
ncbi:MAG: EamA family transporter [Haloferacaceae archaeon]